MYITAQLFETQNNEFIIKWLLLLDNDILDLYKLYYIEFTHMLYIIIL